MNAEKPLVAFCLLGDISRNSRALRQIRALVNAEFRVHAIGFTKSNPNSISETNCEIHLLAYPQQSGPLLFLAAHQTLKSHLKSVKADYYHASDLYSLSASASAALKHKALLTYDSRELYPHVESLANSPLKSAAWAALEKYQIKNCDLVFTVSEGIAQHLAKTYGIPSPIVIHNTPDLAHQVATTTRLTDLSKNPDDLIVIHNGQIRPGRGCLNLAKAIQQTENISLLFLGDGPLKPQIEDFASEAGLQKKISFVDPVPPDMVLSVTRQASIGATVLEDTCLNHRFALPNKLFEYATAGIPVLGSNLPEMASIIKNYEIGALINPADPSNIARTLNTIQNNRDLLAKWKQNTYTVAETFSWKKASEAFSEAFLNLESSS